MDPICQNCNERSATLIYDDGIKKKYLCDNCFRKVDSINKSFHFAPNEIHAKGMFSKNNLNNERNLRFPCPHHKDEGLKYLCQEDVEVICADCVVIGSHKNHTVLTLDEAKKDILLRLQKNISYIREILDKTQKFYNNLERKKETEVNEIKIVKSNIQKAFTEIESALNKKKIELFSYIDESERKTNGSTNNMYNELSQEIKNLTHKIKRAEDTIKELNENINPNNFKVYMNVSGEEIQEKALRFQGLDDPDIYQWQTLNFNLNTSQVLSEISMLSFNQYTERKIERIYKTSPLQATSRTNEISYNYLNETPRKKYIEPIPPIGKYSPSVHEMSRVQASSSVSKINRQEIMISDIRKHEIKNSDHEIKYKIFLSNINFHYWGNYSKNTNYYCSFFRDKKTTKWYFSSNFSNVRKIMEYHKFESFFEGKKGRDKELQYGFDGTYLVALGGYIYYNHTSSNTIIKAKIEDGMAVDKVSIPDAGYRNVSHFNWGGYTDISLLIDELNETIYVFFQLKFENSLRVSQLIVNPKLSIGKTWVLTGKKKGEIGYAFVYGGIIYMAHSYISPNINIAFNLEKGSLEIDPNIILPEKNWTISSIYFWGEERTIVISESNKVSLLKSDEVKF